jgi:ABC-type protease/lipase transport system fused ATPase/permease subunit
MGLIPKQVKDKSIVIINKHFLFTLFTYDVQQLTLLKTKLKGITRKQQEGDFICDMQQILDFLQSNTLGQKKDVVLFIMYKIERFLLKPKTGPQKLQLAVKLLSPRRHQGCSFELAKQVRNTN